MGQISSDHQTVTLTFSWCKFGFGKDVGASWSNHWADHCQLLYKIHFLLHVNIWWTNCSLLLWRKREDDTSKWRYFWFAVTDEACTYQTFSTFLLFFTCWKTVEWSTLSYLETSSVVSRGSVLMMVSVVVVNFWWLATVLSIFKALVSSAKLLEPPPHYTFLSSSWAKCVVYIVDVLFSAVSTSHAQMLNMWNVAKPNSQNNRIFILIKHSVWTLYFQNIIWAYKKVNDALLFYMLHFENPECI